MAWTRQQCESLDEKDEIGFLKERFVVPAGSIYLEGNSLGAMPATVPERVAEVLDHEWGELGAKAWGLGAWMGSPQRVGDKIARLIGACPGEVIACESTTIALTKALGAVLDASDRHVLLSTTTNFPSDLYAAEGLGRFSAAGPALRLVEPEELGTALEAGDVAAMFVTQVDFRTGRLHDVGELTRMAHEAGTMAIWDLCHSVGAVPVGCEENQVDLALGCGYKYLNGGPGSPAFLYVRREHQERLSNPLPGWIGHEDPMSFDPSYLPAADVSRFLTSTPPVIALAAFEAALDVFEGVTIEQVRAKSIGLTSLFMEVVSGETEETVRFATPPESWLRGSQVSIRHPEAASLMPQIAEKGVLGDYRPPGICRFGFAPLYLSYAEVYDAARIVAGVIGNR